MKIPPPDVPDLPSARPTMATLFPHSDTWPEYELVDIGERRKLERFGSVLVDRPEPQALWRKHAPPGVWEAADMSFNASDDQDAGAWQVKRGLPREWAIQFEKVTAICRTTSFRHVGVFPEQSYHWRWIVRQVEKSSRPPSILNLFGYTGIVSLLAAAAGATVTHVDASKKAIAWARENQERSGLSQAPIRWICDDASRPRKRRVDEQPAVNCFSGLIPLEFREKLVRL